MATARLASMPTHIEIASRTPTRARRKRRSPPKQPAVEDLEREGRQGGEEEFGQEPRLAFRSLSRWPQFRPVLLCDKTVGDFPSITRVGYRTTRHGRPLAVRGQ